MGQAQFGILGTLEVRVAELPLRLSAAQLRRLASSLVLTPGRPVRHDVLVEQLWPGDGPEARPQDPLATLRVYASRLRKLLPAGTGPHVDVNGYRITLDKGDVDAERFEAKVTASAEHLPHDPGGAAAALHEALGLWRGPALLEFRDETWAQGTAARLDELRQVAQERLYEVQLALGEHGRLCAELEAVVEVDPLRERPWAQLMTALYRSGRQAEALRAYQRLREYLISELGIEPSRALVELEGAILRQDRSLDLPTTLPAVARSAGVSAAEEPADASVDAGRAPVPPPTHGDGDTTELLVPVNLPLLLTSFIGRERETEEVRELVGTSRLVTLAGAGGAGKTRLSLEAASGLVSQFRDGVFVVELAALDDPADVAPTVASALGIKPRVSSPVVAALLEALRSQQILVLLDNCEHLTASCAELCDTLLASCPELRVLTTSRQPLGVHGEVVYRIPPLDLPPGGEAGLAAVAGADAVRLFVERARSQRHTFELDASNAATVASICRRLDGMPLALELAAARVGALSVDDIDSRLDQRFRLLVGGSRRRLPRQQTLRALIDWSYDLLDGEEQELLRRLSVFSGSFDLASAEAVLEQSGADAWTVLDHVASLVEKSLVLAEDAGPTMRYRMLETIRQYALDRLSEDDPDGVLERLRQAHAEVYLELAETAAPELATRRQLAWLDRLEVEHDNLRQALSHLVWSSGETVRAMRMAVALARYFDWRGHERELLTVVDELEGRPELEVLDPIVARYLLVRLKQLGQIDPKSAMARLEKLVAGARALGDGGLTAEALNRLAWLAWSTGDYAACGRFHDDAVATARAAGRYLPLALSLMGGGASRAERLEALELAVLEDDAIAQCMVLSNLGALALDEGDVGMAREYFEQALPLMEAVRPGDDDAALLVNLGNALVVDGEHAAANLVYTRALESARRHLDERQTGYGLLGLAMCASGYGDSALAAQLHGAAAAQFERGAFALEEAEGRLASADEARLRGALGDDAFEAARRIGRAMTKSEAVELALARGT